MSACIHCKKALTDSTVYTHRCRVKQRPPRRKSCTNCYTAKVRCELSTKGCARCKIKNLECRFPNGLIPRTPQTRMEIPSPELSVSPGGDFGRLDSTGDDMDFTTMLDDLGSNSIPDIDTPVQPMFSWAELNIPTPSQFEFSLQPESESSDSPNRGTGDIIIGQFKAPWTPNHFLCSRFIVQQAQPPGTRPTVVSLTEKLMVTALRSYPNMMKSDGVPPFIHFTQPGHNDMKIALEDCVSLVVLWKSQKIFNKRFVGESVDRERMRLLGEVSHSLHLSSYLVHVITYEQYRSLPMHGMLAAIQAFTIYALLEYLDIDSADSEAMNKYIPAIHEMAYYSFRPGIVCNSELVGRYPSWEDWILVESRRRLILVLFLFDSLIELQKGNNVTVCPEISEMPLSSSKRLWEAPDRETWVIEYAKFLRSQRGGMGMLKLKDLWGGANEEKLEEWIAEMDVLGSALLGIAMSANKEGRL